MDLLNRRRNWVEREMGIERMLLSPPAAPLGIPENTYDLASLSEVGGGEELRIYHQMLNDIEAAMEDLWRRWVAAAEAES
jgi:hypothetical protein